MEMEDQHHQQTQYAIDLRQFISAGGVARFPSIPHPPPCPSPDLFASHHHRNLQPPPPPPPPHHHHHYDMMMLMPRSGGLAEFRSDSSTSPANNIAGGTDNNIATAAATTAVPMFGGLDATEAGPFGGDGGTGRWPRQETLTLLEIRSRLDSKFKEANQKGPLWDEVSRIMSEEHGYQRSGKKCREKFENLYKYYKKTKEGKAGRQDGKHYRFFRQLEALYGETSNLHNQSTSNLPEVNFGSSLQFHNNTSSTTQPNRDSSVHSQKGCESLSLSGGSSELESSSYGEDNDLSTATLDSTEKRRKRRGGWKAKIKDFIDSHMKKLIERQEAWLEKLTKTLEQREQERVFREEEWRKGEAARLDREHKFWAKERAWIEARDSALMEALEKLSGKELVASSPEIPNNQTDQIQTDQDGSETRKCKEANKKRKENNARSNCSYNFQSTSNDHESMYTPVAGGGEGGGGTGYCEINDRNSAADNSNAGNAVSESCFRFLMGDGGENIWENYGLKLNNGDDQNQ